MKLLLFTGIQVLAFIYVGIKILLDPKKFSAGVHYKDHYNSFCQSNLSNTSSPLIDHLTCKNEIKKDKFIWFMFDGLAYDEV
jgi:hypothetical protein